VRRGKWDAVSDEEGSVSYFAFVFGAIGRLYAARCALRPWVHNKSAQCGGEILVEVWRRNHCALDIVNGGVGKWPADSERFT
jgi:hypothetical protein